MGDKFAITSELNGFCLNVEGGSKADGANVITEYFKDWDNQKFRFYYSGIIESVNSGKVLTVEGGVVQGNKIVQMPSKEAPNQLWRIHKDGSIRLVGSNLCIDIQNSKKETGASVILWPYDGHYKQCWRLVNKYD